MKNLELEDDQVKIIRRALLVGLSSLGEVERLVNAQELAKLAGDNIPDELRALQTTGDANTISEFACALRFFEPAPDDESGK